MSMMSNINEPTSKVNSEVVTVGTTKVQLPSYPEASWLQIMHEHATAKVYIGGSTLTTANGFGSLLAGDTTERYTAIFYAISDTAGVSLRLLWGE